MPSASHCPVCRREFTRTGDAIKTRDHIMPVAWGGSTSFYGAGGMVDRKTRPMCARCNCLRGSVGHCIGALACAIAVANTECAPVPKIIRRWGFSRVHPGIGGKRMRAWIRQVGLAPASIAQSA